MTKKIAIAIDGPAAAGKSTVAKLIAKRLSYLYIDTGAMYRALTYKALEKSVNVEDEEALVTLLQTTDIELLQHEEGQYVKLDQLDVTTQIRNKDVTNNVSYIAKHARVREVMVSRQQELAKQRGVVMDGRDIGTKVIPDAEVKIFLIASVEERARRRYEENRTKGYPSDMEELRREIEKRDLIDSQREASPLVKADDAVEMDTTRLSIEEVADHILRIVQEKTTIS